MPASLSAVDAIAPAFARMRAQLFQPFRFSVWARLAVVALTTGELSGNWGGSTNFSLPPQWGGSGAEGWSRTLGAAGPSASDAVFAYLPWIVVGVALLLVLGVLWLYCSCVFRFILFESVLHARCEIRNGWRRWQTAGGSYFLWTLAFLGVSLGALAMLVGVPVFLAWRAGLFKNPDQNFGLLFAGGVLLILVFLGLVLVSYAIDLLARDFVIPVMVLENVGVIDSWRRFLPLLRAEKGGFAIYVLMKIVLVVGSEILFAIVNLFVILVCLLPSSNVPLTQTVRWPPANRKDIPLLPTSRAMIARVVSTSIGTFGAFTIGGFVADLGAFSSIPRYAYTLWGPSRLSGTRKNNSSCCLLPLSSRLIWSGPSGVIMAMTSLYSFSALTSTTTRSICPASTTVPAAGDTIRMGGGGPAPCWPASAPTGTFPGPLRRARPKHPNRVHIPKDDRFESGIPFSFPSLSSDWRKKAACDGEVQQKDNVLFRPGTIPHILNRLPLPRQHPRLMRRFAKPCRQQFDPQPLAGFA